MRAFDDAEFMELIFAKDLEIAKFAELINFFEI